MADGDRRKRVDQLRSARWLRPDDLRSFGHRSRLKQMGYGSEDYAEKPVIGIIKEVLGFRQFSLRGLAAATGEWCLVCLAYNLKRMCTLYQAQGLF